MVVRLKNVIFGNLDAGADTGVGRWGRSPRPLAKDAPPNRVKCSMCGTFCGESPPGGADFALKVPQVGQILWRKCPRQGRFCRESAPGGADSSCKRAEGAPRHRCRTHYLPQKCFLPRPLKIPASAPDWMGTLVQDI